MRRDDFPAPRQGIVLTHFLTVKDQDRSRAFYADVHGYRLRKSSVPNCFPVSSRVIFPQYFQSGGE